MLNLITSVQLISRHAKPKRLTYTPCILLVSFHLTNQEFVSALCNEHWWVEAGRVTSATKTNIDSTKFEGPGGSLGPSGANTPAVSSAIASAATSAAPSEASSAVNSDNEDEMKFKGRKFPKKKKMTRAQQKDREVRRRLRHIEWLNSPKG